MPADAGICGTGRGVMDMAEKKEKKPMDYDAVTGEVLKASLRIVVGLILTVIVYLCVVKSYSFGYGIFQDEAYHPDSERSVSVTIPPGCSSLEIGEALVSADIIENAYVFVIQTKLYQCKIQPGVHVISDAMSPSEILNTLSETESEV